MNVETPSQVFSRRSVIHVVLYPAADAGVPIATSPLYGNNVSHNQCLEHGTLVQVGTRIDCHDVHMQLYAENASM